MDKPDRRRSPRAPARLRTEVRCGDAREELLTREIGLRGVFVLSGRPRPRRQLLSLTFVLPDGEELDVNGMVARSVAPEEARKRGVPAGMGVQFYGLSKQALEEWEKFFFRVFTGRGPNASPPVGSPLDPAAHEGQGTSGTGSAKGMTKRAPSLMIVEDEDGVAQGADPSPTAGGRRAPSEPPPLPRRSGPAKRERPSGPPTKRAVVSKIAEPADQAPSPPKAGPPPVPLSESPAARKPSAPAGPPPEGGSQPPRSAWFQYFSKDPTVHGSQQRPRAIPPPSPPPLPGRGPLARPPTHGQGRPATAPPLPNPGTGAGLGPAWTNGAKWPPRDSRPSGQAGTAPDHEHPNGRTSGLALAPDETTGPVVYRLALSSIIALRGFSDRALAAHGIFMRTVDTRPPGTAAVVCLVHPVSGDEFHLPGEVVSLGGNRDGVAVAFHGVTSHTFSEFNKFIARAGSGERPPDAVRPQAGDDEPLTMVHTGKRRGPSAFGPALENAQDVEPTSVSVLLPGRAFSPLDTEPGIGDFEELSVADLIPLGDDEL